MTAPVRPRIPTLSERIDRSLLSLHALPGLDVRTLARTLGVPALIVTANHWLHRGSSVRSALARIRVDVAQRVLREQAVSVPSTLVRRRAAEYAGFRSLDEMDRAFLRYRHRTSFDLLLSTRVTAAGPA
ncbi:hypothetical protein C5C18_01855 [Rathayibacter tritici]|uniref:HTH araC/xylS-type domain-containing protein n=1 Tax=Rathayibacter tritici TaxID=33888 RepID=A0A160KVH2_9MICO|nr:hypothetical protein [Rathayibacter tritici]AND17960.1 hypothetical protein A6122_2852 [Rathayibacter tritici]PPF26800.1 hypothetical protein C5C06_10760 [Rathayibacter tritici]PPF69819.1 hypothetical protein C5C21_02395 [Rathayibacter tritici]PPG09148.1 hypothetical protein C5C18_01855 [Rathayibacter tritici]PPI18147.1 hypothetical protein C5D07_03760 [Rathayibacter tritici]